MMRKWSPCLVLLTLMILLPNQVALSQPIQGLPHQTPQVDFFPHPPPNDTYWWMFQWCGDESAGFQCSSSRVGISAKHYYDGAFDGEPLISLNFFKEDPATYWGGASYDVILRWYSRGFTWVPGGVVDSQSGQRAHQFVSFRGHSLWCPDRDLDTMFSTVIFPLYFLEGKYSFNNCPDKPSAYFGGSRYGRADFLSIPLYAVVPDIPLNADVQAIHRASAGQSYCDLSHPTHGWTRMRNCDPTAHPGSGCNCTPDPDDQRWRVSWRKVPTSQYTFQGKQVQYAGFSETEPGSAGPCEEWWFAEDIGPIYILSYPNKTRSQCLNLLNSTAPGGFKNDPEDQVSRRVSDLFGVLRLENRCLSSACNVDL